MANATDGMDAAMISGPTRARERNRIHRTDFILGISSPAFLEGHCPCTAIAAPSDVHPGGLAPSMTASIGFCASVVVTR